ncbi:MAG: 16S rRNA (uracil(1498)-N(3))-methyltransferase [Actinomycetota bacterium]|nr:16S rRNA (uracil(1498)-N(3))-methyltransferase [Actinomycetota bacterium]
MANVDSPVLEDQDLHHLLGVLRIRSAQTVTVADGCGRWRPCAVASVADRRPLSATLEPLGNVVHESVLQPAITVAFALTKGDRPEWALGKLTELGVDRIIPLVTARSVVREDDKRSERRQQRWTKIARQAAMQSRRVWLPVIESPADVAVVVASAPGAAVLARPGGDAPTLQRPTVLVGPEGGWSPAEEMTVSASVGLGLSVLRSETAAVAAATVFGALRAGLVDEHRGRSDDGVR